MNLPEYLYPSCAYVQTLQHTTTHCNTLQHNATNCKTLQHTATHCNRHEPFRELELLLRVVDPLTNEGYSEPHPNFPILARGVTVFEKFHTLKLCGD